MGNMKTIMIMIQNMIEVRVRDFIMFVEGIDFEYYLHGHDGLYLTKKELLEKMRETLNG